ncbi:hypothetical protein AQJ64_41635 [Streptomyces griseoruber]|uniref:Uncharacterized protein n=1 Tax=Streptomyces griseoruber TaxID=1943 RepID=A0A117R7S4_9ACTN|nr:hypothetical protein AQJ64_41635 [Streptomyces griseoruber]
MGPVGVAPGGAKWRRPSHFEAAVADHIEDPYDALTVAIALYAAVASLGERQFDAILLHYRMGFTGPPPT